jgi:hypothetical protein
MIPGSDEKRSRQSAWLMTAAGAAPGPSSPVWKNRPRIGRTRRTSKKPALTCALVRRIGSSTPLRLTPWFGM